MDLHHSQQSQEANDYQTSKLLEVRTNVCDDQEEKVFETQDDTKAAMTETEKFKFTSTFSTYMTLLGFSIGMSDFWRFPFLAYRNGGGDIIFRF